MTGKDTCEYCGAELPKAMCRAEAGRQAPPLNAQMLIINKRVNTRSFESVLSLSLYFGILNRK